MKKMKNGIAAGLMLMVGIFCFAWGSCATAAEVMPTLEYLYEDTAEDGVQMVSTMVDTGDIFVQQAVLVYENPDGSESRYDAAQINGGYAAFFVDESTAEQAQLKTLELNGEEKFCIDLENVEPSSEMPVVPESRTFGSPGALNKTGNQVVVVLDPGHGGYDSGAMRTWNGISYVEKNIVLKLAKYTKEELEKYDGITVYLTRDTDVYLTLTERVDYAAKMGATVLISQHINSTSENKSTATGAEVMVSSGNYNSAQAAETASIARSILSNLNTLGFYNRDLVYRMSETGNTYPNGKLADYYGIVRQSVLYGFPGMIVEHGFVSNPSDCTAFYGSDQRLREIAAVEAKAIADHYGRKNQNLNAWNQENGNWYYLDANGNRLTNQWLTVDGKKYYLNANGYRLNGWKKIDKKQYFFGIDGIMRTGLVTTGGEKFWFTPQGVMRTGFFRTAEGNWYYTNSKGYLHTGWKTYKGNRYYFHQVTGAAIVGWRALGKATTSYYYFDENGKMQTGMIKVDGEHYYLRPSGKRATGLVKHQNKRYYFDKNTGKMVRAQWVNENGNWYYFRKNGVAYCNTVKKIGKKKYRFNEKGICLNKKR